MCDWAYSELTCQNDSPQEDPKLPQKFESYKQLIVILLLRLMVQISAFVLDREIPNRFKMHMHRIRSMYEMN